MGMVAFLIFRLAFGADESALSSNSSLNGEWKVVVMKCGLEEAMPEDLAGMKWRIEYPKIYATEPNGSGIMSFDLNESPSHKSIDITAVEGGNQVGTTDLGIYSLVGNRLTICLRNVEAAGRGRPTKITAKDDCWLMVLVRESK